MEQGNDPAAGTELAPKPRSITTASNLFRRELCLGSAIAEHGLPELETSGAADFGTEMHLMESEMIDPVSVESFRRDALIRNQQVTRVFLESLFAEEADDCEILREHEFIAKGDDGKIIYTVINGEYHPLTGTADEVRYYPKHKAIVIMDSKFGRWPVTAANLNMQLRLYALCAYDRFRSAEFIYVAIRQPYLPEPLNFHSAVYRAGQMPAVRKQISDIIANSSMPNYRKASVEACRFCRAQGTSRCPESMNLVRQLALRKVASLRPDELEKLAPAVEAAASVVEAWKQRLKQVLSHYPSLIKGFELAPTGQTRTITDNAAAFTALRDVLGDRTTEVFLKACKISIPTLIEETERVFKESGRTAPADVAVLSAIQHLVETSEKEKRIRKKKVLP